MSRFQVGQKVCLVTHRECEGTIHNIQVDEHGSVRYVVEFSDDDIQKYDEALLVEASAPIQASDPVFKKASDVKIAAFWDQLYARFGETLVPTGWRDFDARPPIYDDLDPIVQLHPALEYLIFSTNRVLPEPGCRLYRHQAEALNALYNGNNVTIVTPTASGKTLVYAIPTIDAMLKDTQATALYISPLNALVQDQLDAFCRFDEQNRNWSKEAQHNQLYHYIRPITLGNQTIQIARYDGGVPREMRLPIRNAPPHMIITNPDMLHWSILPYHSGWKHLLKHLRFIILDEMHTYKGFFGAHVANLLRRLRRLCAYYGSQPRFICASATIKNPAELAERLTGQQHTVIGADRDGSPRYLRRFVLWDSARSGNAIATDAANLMTELIATHRIKTITFGRSINAVQSIYNYVAMKLRDIFKLPTPLVQPYWSELTSEEKRQIAHKLKHGLLQGVTTTTALKLGIDIGDLSAAIIVKYPGSIADVWQQAGRAGRRGEALIVLIADSDPLNQYFANHPEEFFDMEPEEVFLDPDNKYAVLGQLWCAARDLPIDMQRDRQFFGDSLPEYLNILTQEHDSAGYNKIQQSRSSGKDVWVLTNKDGFPIKEVPIRSFGFRLAVYDTSGKRLDSDDDQTPILNVDSVRAMIVLHPHARYQKIDDWYEVVSFQLDDERKAGSVRVKKLQPPVTYRTFARSDTANEIIALYQSRDVFGEKLSFGMIEFRSQVEGFYKVYMQGGGDRRTEYQDLTTEERPPQRIFETTATWITLPTHLADNYDQATFQAGLTSLTRALEVATTIQEFCDPEDVGSMKVAQDDETKQPMIFVYDTTPGGVGISEQAFHNFETIFRRAYRLLNDCPNAEFDPDHIGCPKCVTTEWGDEDSVNRLVALDIMRAMFDTDTVPVPRSEKDIVTILTNEGYQQVRFAASGGMGSIYYGVYNGQKRAIKVLKPTTTVSREDLDRMVQEIRIWQDLIHPNIMRVLEVNQPEGVLYVTMDWMPKTLHHEMYDGAMNQNHVLELMLGIARALKYLTQRGYVHRDVKPKNILLDTQGQPRLTDFGIAKSLNDTLGCQTQSGAIMGTVNYLAPESFRHASTSTNKADMFALGVVLWEMLTGKLPPRDTTGAVVPDAFDQITHQHPAFVEILKSLLATDPVLRLSADGVVELCERMLQNG